MLSSLLFKQQGAKAHSGRLRHGRHAQVALDAFGGIGNIRAQQADVYRKDRQSELGGRGDHRGMASFGLEGCQRHETAAVQGNHVKAMVQ
nr:hypothetical protein [uncultured Devosia sp.]